MGPHPTPASLSICRRVKQAGTIRVPPPRPPPPTSPPSSRPLWGCCVSGQRWNKPQARYFTINDRPVSNHFLPDHLCKDRAPPPPPLSLRSFGPSLNCVFTFHLLLTLSWAWNDEFLVWIASTLNWSLMTRKLRGITDCHTMNETGHFLRFTPAVWTLPGIFPQIERIPKKPTGLSQLNALYYPEQWVQTTATKYHSSRLWSKLQSQRVNGWWLTKSGVQNRWGHACVLRACFVWRHIACWAIRFQSIFTVWISTACCL